MSKPILGLTEEIKLYLANKKFIRLQAKIDTGAHFSAVDKKYAIKLGYEKSLKKFNQLCPKFKINKDNYEKIKKILKNRYKHKLIKECPGLVDVKLIPATNGFSIRPFFKIKFALKNKKIITKASLIDRAHMKFLFLVGKHDMKGFLIDPTKNNYYTL
jgi:hypothetical protein